MGPDVVHEGIQVVLPLRWHVLHFTRQQRESVRARRRLGGAASIDVPYGRS